MKFYEDCSITTSVVPLEHVLRCSLEKIHKAKRCRSGANLRRNLMIANVIFKARNEILEYRTRMFMERNKQLPGIKGRIMCSPTAFVAEKCFDTDDEEEKDASRTEEVLEECLVQDEFLIEQDAESEDGSNHVRISDTEEEEEEEEEYEEIEICVDMEKQVSFPSCSLTPLSLELPGDVQYSNYKTQSPRKRRSTDGEVVTSELLPWPCKRSSPEISPESVFVVASTTISSLSENFQKSISFQLPCGLVDSTTKNNLVDLTNSCSHGQPSLLFQLNQHLAVAAS